MSSVDSLRSLTVGWQIAGVLVVLVCLGWVLAPPIQEPAVVHSEVSLEQQVYWRKIFEPPILTPDEWKAQCGTPYDFGPTERGHNHCTIQVVVDCPPDCSVYKILIEDRLLRRLW